MAKSRNNLLGVGGQRKKMSRDYAQGAAADRANDRKTADEKKQELLRMMRERAQANDGDGPAAEADTEAKESAKESEEQGK